ncbi:hypothetical protein TEA_022266 [Camellia sinensis var. sinensis]|uniref:MADS-box domain-containing protein n=1 Tax=Camellia sinensis var. sinensis TaxID=542762 RepID=A0A4S4EP31_CAMSN|nr:hypothetical protein TEA_022266 [Camellia sinensis var. sinensis]
MARGKVQMKRIENPVHRQVTFCKRRAGLLKKAKELSVLCDAEIAVLIFSANGKLYELSTKGTMQGLVGRYMKSTGDTQADHDEEKQVMMDIMSQEIQLLKTKQLNILEEKHMKQNDQVIKAISKAVEKKAVKVEKKLAEALTSKEQTSTTIKKAKTLSKINIRIKSTSRI